MCTSDLGCLPIIVRYLGMMDLCNYNCIWITALEIGSPSAQSWWLIWVLVCLHAASSHERSGKFEQIHGRGNEKGIPYTKLLVNQEIQSPRRIAYLS